MKTAKDVAGLHLWAVRYDHITDNLYITTEDLSAITAATKAEMFMKREHVTGKITDIEYLGTLDA